MAQKDDFVLGGFGAFGTPSSVHNETARNLREWCLNALAEPLRKFGAVINQQRVSNGQQSVEFSAQSIIDRFMFRRAGRETQVIFIIFYLINN